MQNLAKRVGLIIAVSPTDTQLRRKCRARGPRPVRRPPDRVPVGRLSL